MATDINYTPDTAITKAMFNFDAFGLSDYKLDGTIRVSVSDDYLAAAAVAGAEHEDAHHTNNEMMLNAQNFGSKPKSS